MGLKGRLKKLEKAAEVETIEIPQEDGTAKKFRAGAVMDAFLNMAARGRAHYHGEELPPPHPLTVALRTVEEGALPRLMSEHGTIVGLIKGEDMIYEGLMERPGRRAREETDGS
ncbi:MAG: hypothetical protein M3N18_13075 [Actinomycetota bacterium]|nr:hypothetical protein [Actinomycetota bacterium]